MIQKMNKIAVHPISFMAVILNVLLFGVSQILSNNLNLNLAVPTGQLPTSQKVFDPASRQIENWAAHHSLVGSETVRDDSGCSVPSLTASLGIVGNDNLLLQDVFTINKLAAFNRERIPERVVHAKGHGAFGYLQMSRDLSFLTKADFLNGVGKKTPLLVRFSMESGKQGSSDLLRGERGMAIKFYTNDGVYDLIGNVAGTFPIRDPMLATDMRRSRKENPVSNVKDNTMLWDFMSVRPESILHTLNTYSDFGANSRVINCLSVHAFKFVNKQGVPVFVKFHFISQQPFKWFNNTEIDLVSGIDSNYNTRDLYNAITKGNYPRWTLNIQVMTVEQALRYPVNPFDSTKVWRPEEFPLTPVGVMVLDRNAVDVFNDIEQSAFNPGRLVPGIEASPDRLFHGRMFAYADAQRYRLGPNYARLKVNRPKFPVSNYDRDGFMRDNPNGAGGPNYFPNSFHGPAVNGSVMESSFHVRGIVDRVDTVNDTEDNYRLARLYLYKDLTRNQRERVAHNLAASLAKATKEVRERAVRNLFFRVSQDFGQLVWQKMQQNVAKN